MTAGYDRHVEYQEASARLAAASKGPTVERGTPFDAGWWGGPSLPGTRALLNLAMAEDLEHVPELMHPNSTLTYRNMRNDAQLDALYRATTMPILRYKWSIDENGCDPSKVTKLSADLGLPIKGKDPAPIPRYKRRFQFRKHLGDALRALYYGHYCFEQVGEYDDSNNIWHLRKLAARPPHTIDELGLADDGGLVVVKQNTHQRDLPVDQIVWYAWEQEGANWWGRSWFRSCYRNWLIKDRLLRVDAVKHERNGMGVPVGVGAQGYTDEELRALARLSQSFRAGENAGGAIPFGTDLKLLGVSGTIPDTMGSVRFHNEEMARAWMAMLLDLGSTKHGSRALGEEFGNRLDLSQDAVALWFRDNFIEHVIEDWWDWNVGEDEEFAPRLHFEHDDDPRVATADLALMIQNDVIQVDDELEKAVREAMHLPDKDEKTVRLKPTPSGNATPADGDVSPDANPDDMPPNVKDQEKPTPAQASARTAADRTVSSPAKAVSRLHPEDLEDHNES